MAINPKTHGLHHIALRCSDFSITKKFYNEILGLPLVRDTEEIIGFMAGSVFVGFKKAQPLNPSDNVFTPFNIGLDHVAIACETEEELNRVSKALEEAGVDNTGILRDAISQKLYVAFKDPDRIAWEFYMM